MRCCPAKNMKVEAAMIEEITKVIMISTSVMPVSRARPRLTTIFSFQDRGGEVGTVAKTDAFGIDVLGNRGARAVEWLPPLRRLRAKPPNTGIGIGTGRVAVQRG